MLMNLLKYASLTTAQLTPVIVAEVVGTVLNKPVDVDDSMFNDVVLALREDNIDKLADIAQKPELLAKLKSIISSHEGKDDNLIICPHCGEYLNPN